MIRNAQTALAKAECKSAAAAKSIRAHPWWEGKPFFGRKAKGKNQKAKVTEPDCIVFGLRCSFLPFAFIEDAEIVVGK